MQSIVAAASAAAIKITLANLKRWFPQRTIWNHPQSQHDWKKCRENESENVEDIVQFSTIAFMIESFALVIKSSSGWIKSSKWELHQSFLSELKSCGELRTFTDLCIKILSFEKAKTVSKCSSLSWRCFFLKEASHVRKLNNVR